LNFKETLLFLLGIVFALIALLFVVGAFATFEDEHSFQTSDAILLVVTIVILGLAVWICIRSIQKSKLRKGDQQENQILKLTAQYGGRITATEIAMNTTLSIEKAKSILDAFVDRKIAILKLSDNGTYVYEFFELLSQEEKRIAKGIYEA
jgi:type VI protein secretion system component VasK